MTNTRTFLSIVVFTCLVAFGGQGSAGTSDCCTNNGTPGCSDSVCQACVCTLDAFCCDTEWDGICAGEAQSECAEDCNCPPPPACGDSFPVCNGTCPEDQVCFRPGGIIVGNLGSGALESNGPIDPNDACTCVTDTCSGTAVNDPLFCGENQCPPGFTCRSGKFVIKVDPADGVADRPSGAPDPNDPNAIPRFFCNCVPEEIPCGDLSAPCLGGACPPTMICAELFTDELGQLGAEAAAPNDPNLVMVGCGCIPDPNGVVDTCTGQQVAGDPGLCGENNCPPGQLCSAKKAAAPGRPAGEIPDPNDPNAPLFTCGCIDDPNEPNQPPGSGDCCVDNGSVGCEQADCQSCVCNIDPFCCDVAWDSICASEAADPSCNLVCECAECGATAPTCDGRCPDGTICQSAGDPNDPNGFMSKPSRELAVGGGAGSDGLGLCLCVDDPNDPNEPNQPPGDGDCCDSGGNGTPGCDDPTCQECVCGLDPFCCDTSWDGICAGHAANECAGSCLCDGVRPTATPTVTPTMTPTMTPTPLEGGGPDDCIDLMDNDGDGLIDCDDPGCAGNLVCLPAAPAMSPPMTLVLIVVLCLIGMLGLARMQTVKKGV